MLIRIKIFLAILIAIPLSSSLGLEVGESIDSAMSQDRFDYFVQLDITDLEYEIDVHHSFLLQTIKAAHDGTADKTIARKISLLGKVHKSWLDEVEKLKKLDQSHEKLSIVKFVLTEGNGIHRQGLLVISDKTIIKVLWDDGVMFYNGLTLNGRLGDRD